MLLADMGADVIRVDRAQSVRGPAPAEPPKDVSLRNRRSVAIDLKHPDGVATLLDLVEHADAIIEGFRPGVMERLGIGPDECFARNPKLVFGRMTGWGQDGPYAPWAGHDINYISLAGALAHIGRAGEAPVPPLNLVGDFGGGGMFLAFGVVCALLEAQQSGQGQVVDAAMVDGTATLMSMFWGMSQVGVWDGSQRGVNLLDTGAHFYDAYECADGGYISLGSIEPQFYAELLRLTELSDDPQFAKQMDKSQWPALKDRLRGGVQGQDARRVVRADGAHRRLLRPGADDGRGRRAPAQRRPPDDRRARRPQAAGAGAALQPHRAGDLPVAAARRPGHRRRPRRLGHPQGPHRQARRRRRRRRQLSVGHPDPARTHYLALTQPSAHPSAS